MRDTGRRLCLVLAGLILTVALAPAPASCAPRDRAGADSPLAAGTRPAAPRAPTAPPLFTPAGALPPDEGGAGIESTQSDPLVANGLRGPLCNGALGPGELSPTGARNCETSGFVAAAAPTGDYGLDSRIDTGALGLGEGALLSIVQTALIAPVWMALVWGVHALVVAVEWAFTLDLLDSAGGESLGRSLREMQATFTVPWLTLSLAVGAVLTAHNGLVRRRVTESLGQALTMGAMIVGGLWVTVDPTGSVGAFGRWANQASLGTLSVAVAGGPGQAGRSLSGGVGDLYAAVVEAPWCYLEFGDVAWCTQSADLDPRLHRSALGIAAVEDGLIGCHAPAGVLPCVASGTAQARALEVSARLLREARTNGALFLALPPNGWARNSVSQHGTLLQTLCGGNDATSCHGPTAAQAEFRTNAGTWPRLGGLLLIVAGSAGMLVLLGYVTLRLLGASMLALLCLLLAPAMVILPALGEAGRDVFRRWAVHLLGAIGAKLVFSFLLGAVLAVAGVLMRLHMLGWWTQWLLMSVFWWVAFLNRHRVLGLVHGAEVQRRSPTRGSFTRRLGEVVDLPLRTFVAARKRKARGRYAVPDGTVESAGERRAVPDGTAQAAGERNGRRARASDVGRQAESMREVRLREARATLTRAPQIEAGLAARRSQARRVRVAHAEAVAAGDRRRRIRLATRGARVQRELAARAAALDGARRTARSAGDRHLARAYLEAHEGFLDRQASLPRAGSEAIPRTRRRDYRALASLAGYTADEYRLLASRERREVRQVVDRALAERSEIRAATGGTASAAGDTKRSADAHTDGELKFDRVSRREREQGRRGQPEESAVMRDAREVAAGRKRQLGFDRD